MFKTALDAADARQAVLNAVQVKDGMLHVADATYRLADFRRIIVVGAGKATARMAQAIELLLGDLIEGGLIVVKYGHSEKLDRIEQVEAAHPLPDQAGVVATQRVLRLLHEADDRTLVICLLSGGASALLVAPVAGITLQDKQEVTAQLLRAGASIGELNAVRKHLSAVKGGRLAQALAPAQVLTLLVSDVIGDSLDVIASGPTAVDDSTFAEAWAVIGKYGLREQVPLRVMACLKRGVAGAEPETAKQELAHVHNVVVASNRLALAASEQQARLLGFDAVLLSDRMQGEAREIASFLAQTARAELARMQPGERRCLLSGGETTVTVRGKGKGGRNQELALAFALEMEGTAGAALLSAGTDGTDGPTDAAGAIVDGDTAGRARQLGMQPEDYLANNDSYGFFQRLDKAGQHFHVLTGPTGTNVMDLQILLLQKQ
ncbi:MAG TPA: glycerate kinase [Gallionellaceae bacterium]